MTFNPELAPVDYIILSNEFSPGLAVVSNANSPRRWDIRKGYALSGARPVFRGVDLARPIVTFRLLSFEDWNEWHDWREKVGLQRPPLGERARAKDIWHPILEDLGIVSVVVDDVLQPVQVADGEWNIVVKFIEFRRPVFTLESIGSSEERATDPVDREIIALTEQVQVLANQ